MFERYTEGARRTIFFARYEASNFGSPTIDTEHLLLGLLREDKALIRRTLLNVNPETALDRVASRLKPGTQKVSTSVDLPLSEDAQRALNYSAQEADRLHHRHIGTAHLLLGLSADKQFSSAVFLSQLGAELESLRSKVEALGEPAAFARVPTLITPSRVISGPDVIRIHETKFNIEHLRRIVSTLVKFHWRKSSWKSQKTIVNKATGKLSFDLTLLKKFPEEFEVLQGGVRLGHCAICRWELFQSEDASHAVGFTNGKDWLCVECHDRFVARDFFSSSYSDMT
jgi:hypothetical protein